MQVVEGGGFRLLTNDEILMAVVRRCAELERENNRLKRQSVYDFRTVRRDVAQIRKSLARTK